MKIVSRFLAASLSAVLILLSPGLGCYEALAQTVGFQVAPVAGAPMPGLGAVPESEATQAPALGDALDASGLESSDASQTQLGLTAAPAESQLSRTAQAGVAENRAAALQTRQVSAHSGRRVFARAVSKLGTLLRRPASKDAVGTSTGLDNFYSKAAIRAGDVVEPETAASLARPIVRSFVPSFGLGPIVSAIRDGKVAILAPAKAARVSDGTAKALLVTIAVPIKIGLSLAALGLFVYDVYLFFNLFGYFGAPPFNYGVIGQFFASLFATGAIAGVLGKTLTFFRGSSGEEKKGPQLSPAQALKKYVTTYGTIAVIGLPFVLYFNRGHIVSSFLAGTQYFSHWGFPYLLAGLLGFSFLVHAYQKITKHDDGKSLADHAALGVVATFIAPLAEEVLYRGIVFNIGLWFWNWVGFMQPVHYVLPLFGHSVGWGLPLGVLLAMFGNADAFFKAHGKGKWFHHWFMGVIACYAYWSTGSLLAPIAIHLIWNAIASVFDFLLEAALPLNGK